MKFLRAIQLDTSDRQVYRYAAIPGEWAIPGSFALWDADPDTPDGKIRQAFQHGFLGTESFGYSTFVVIAQIDDRELEQVRERIVEHLCAHYGAPSAEAALPVADEEIRFAQSLTEHPLGTMISVERAFGADGIEEQFRVVKPDAGDHAQVKLWALVDD